MRDDQDATTAQLLSPVSEGREAGKSTDRAERVADGVALCLSGGGYRAMLFHVGGLWRLAELGLLPELKRVSSVSGGSITAGLLGLRWRQVVSADAAQTLAQYRRQVAEPLRRLAGRTIDEGSVLGGVFLPGSVGDRVEKAYRKYVFGEATLQDLPTDDQGPRFVINATNVQTTSLWRFSRPYMRDWRVGQVRNPTVPLAVAVAASSAFPPFLSPVRLELDPDEFAPPDGSETLTDEVYRDEVVLTDGGVYDNLGLETAWKRYRSILVSDGGGVAEPEPHPKGDWPRHSFRIIGMLYAQVGSLRKRQLIGSFEQGLRDGAYWGVGTDIRNYHLADALPADLAHTTELAHTPTRLKRLPETLQNRLINWGYAVCDAAIRKHFRPGLPEPTGLPYNGGI